MLIQKNSHRGKMTAFHKKNYMYKFADRLDIENRLLEKR